MTDTDKVKLMVNIIGFLMRDRNAGVILIDVEELDQFVRENESNVAMLVGREKLRLMAKPRAVVIPSHEDVLKLGGSGTKKEYEQ